MKFSFLDTHIDVKGKAYEELVGSNLRGDRGEFFTPRNVQRMAIRMLDIKHGEKILDPSCGTGGFLVIAMNEAISNMRGQVSGLPDSDAYRQALNEQIRDTASRCFFGFDINRELVKATKMNMVMNNDGSGNILQNDSLLHPHQWESEFREKLALALEVSPDALHSPDKIGYFDVIATNPPFGGRLPVSDSETLSQYDLAHVWKRTEDGGWHKTKDLHTSRPPEILFIERCWQLLNPNGGRMAIVLPDGILGNPELEYVRYWLITRCRIVASIDLHSDTFQPHNGTQTSVLILQKKTDAEIHKEEKQRQLDDYEIFMAEVQAVGHDKRGKTVYKRNDDGEEILFEQEETADLFELDAHGQASHRILRPTKQVDDETPLVADEFLAWKQTAVLGW